MNSKLDGQEKVTQEPRTGVRQARPQSAIYTLPRDWDSLDQVLVPLVERIDPMNAATQLLIVTPDIESTIGLVAGAFARFGAQGIDILPATGAARAARLLRTDPARAVAGPPWVLRQLLTSTTLRLDDIRAVLLAWVDDVLEERGETLSELEAVLSEVPKDALRTLVVRGVSPAVERFAERHMHHARRVGVAGSAIESRLPVSYVTAPRPARSNALRRVLDEVDPPSAVVLARDDRSEEEARATVLQLGYRRANDVVGVSRGDVPPNTHTVIFYDVPLNAAPLEIVAESRPTRVIVLVEPRELDALRRLTGGRATPLERSGAPTATRADELLQRDIREVLSAGFGAREINAIEPLLTEFDGAEVAGALVRILERERERSAREREVKGGDRRDRPGGASGGPGERSPRGERGFGAPGERGERGERGPGGARDRGDRRPAAGRDRGERAAGAAREGGDRESRPRRPADGRAKPGFDKRRGPPR